nr:hypothetical protein [Tanacetum cinerariifolium]
MVKVKLPRFILWLSSTNAYDKHIGSLGMMDNKVGNTSPQSTLQILPSFEEYKPPVTYPEEVKEILGTPMEVESLDQMKLEDVGDERGPKPPIKPYSPKSSRMKVVDRLTIDTLPLPHASYFHPKSVYYYHHPCIDDPKKQYGFKPGILGSLAKSLLDSKAVINDNTHGKEEDGEAVKISCSSSDHFFINKPMVFKSMILILCQVVANKSDTTKKNSYTFLVITIFETTNELFHLISNVRQSTTAVQLPVTINNNQVAAKKLETVVLQYRHNLIGSLNRMNNPK